MTESKELKCLRHEWQKSRKELIGINRGRSYTFVHGKGPVPLVGCPCDTGLVKYVAVRVVMEKQQLRDISDLLEELYWREADQPFYDPGLNAEIVDACECQRVCEDRIARARMLYTSVVKLTVRGRTDLAIEVAGMDVTDNAVEQKLTTLMASCDAKETQTDVKAPHIVSNRRFMDPSRLSDELFIELAEYLDMTDC
ncbi:MAG: hypothetical protein KGL39_30090, partial [Patescibacteria group bacterium]|nr:hypothetical protein [Patescibacteria group bacterium]